MANLNAALGFAFVAALGLVPAAQAGGLDGAFSQPASNWSGFYIGADIGGFHSGEGATATALPSGFGAPAIPGAGYPGIGILPTSHSLDGDGFLGGIHAGYNWQTAPHWLLGVEGDVTWLDGRASSARTTYDTFSGPRPDGTMVVSSDGNFLASLRGRIGWVEGPWMVYATGGLAWTNISSRATWTPLPGALGPPPSTSSASLDGNSTGLVVGGGVEWLISRNWSLRAEYLYYDFDGSSGSVPFVVPSNGCTPPGTCGWNVSASDVHINTARVGLSYKF